MIKILMVEDSDEDVDVIQDTLTRELAEFVVTRVSTSEDALRVLGNRYDCILLDLDLPGMGGLEFLEFLRETRTLAPPIVVVTGRGDENRAARAIQLGAKDYVSKKNLTNSCLAMVIQNVLAESALEAKSELESNDQPLDEMAKDSLERANQNLRKISFI